jgi:hypothetical protein
MKVHKTSVEYIEPYEVDGILISDGGYYLLVKTHNKKFRVKLKEII